MIFLGHIRDKLFLFLNETKQTKKPKEFDREWTVATHFEKIIWDKINAFLIFFLSALNLGPS